MFKNRKFFSIFAGLLFGLTLGQLTYFNTLAGFSPITPPISSPVYSNLSANLTNTEAIFDFDYNLLSNFRIDLSTYRDMSWDVYLDFVTGYDTPLRVTNPEDKWDKYNCGSKLYWRAYSVDRSYSTPIQEATVNCPSPAPSATPVPVFSNLSATGSANLATFNFNYSGTSSSYAVDLSTYADMSWDVYLDFAKGLNSPINITNPTKWDKYQCGRTLYFRVNNYNRRVQSPIQALAVVCATPAPTPTPTPTPTPIPTPTASPSSAYVKAVSITSPNITQLRKIAIDPFANFTLSPQSTIEFWLKFNQTPTAGEELLNLSNGRLKVGIKDYNSYLQGYQVYITSSDGITTRTHYPNLFLQTGRWYHIGVSTNGNSVIFYYDGKYENTNLIFGYSNTNKRVEVGKLLNGEIDEIRISNSLRYPTAYVNNSFYTIPQSPFSADGNTLVLFHLDGNLNDVSGNLNYAQVLDQSNFPQVVNYTNSGVTTASNTVVNNLQKPIKQVVPVYKVLSRKGFMATLWSRAGNFLRYKLSY